MPDNRIFDLLRIQGETLARIDQTQQDTRERLFGGPNQLGALQFLQGEITDLKTAVQNQAAQINFWRGAVAVITAVLTAAMSWIGIVVHRHR